MTEAEWFTTEMALYMLRKLPGEMNPRNACLLASACFRADPRYLAGEIPGRYVELVEEAAEGSGDDDELRRLWGLISAGARSFVLPSENLFWHWRPLARFGPYPDRDYLVQLFVEQRPFDDDTATKRAQCRLLRCVLGNPYRVTEFDAACRTDTAVAIAAGMYESREFSAMPILADALQDAGCEDAALLAHCRDQHQFHVRGCWAVDLVLGKE